MKPRSGLPARLEPRSRTLLQGQRSVVPLVVDLWRKRPVGPIAGGDGPGAPTVLGSQQTEPCANEPTLAFDRCPPLVLSLRVHDGECAALSRRCRLRPTMPLTGPARPCRCRLRPTMPLSATPDHAAVGSARPCR